MQEHHACEMETCVQEQHACEMETCVQEQHAHEMEMCVPENGMHTESPLARRAPLTSLNQQQDLRNKVLETSYTSSPEHEAT